MKRQVKVELWRSPYTGIESWVVKYIQRDKYTRYWAAQFDARYNTKNDAIYWALNNPKLELIF